MSTIGIVLVVLAALSGAIVAIARDRRFTSREVFVQLTWTFGFAGISIFILVGLLDWLQGQTLIVALALWFAWMAGGIALLARYLKARLARTAR